MADAATRFSVGLLVAVETTQSTSADPGFGATVASPPTSVLVAGWVLGILALAVLWAVSRR